MRPWKRFIPFPGFFCFGSSSFRFTGVLYWNLLESGKPVAGSPAFCGNAGGTWDGGFEDRRVRAPGKDENVALATFCNWAGVAPCERSPSSIETQRPSLLSTWNVPFHFRPRMPNDRRGARPGDLAFDFSASIDNLPFTKSLYSWEVPTESPNHFAEGDDVLVR